ncbi:P-loop NTPase family protein [Streptomyces mutabilis]|uniref:hypothetical protein n=1 Tax=Streptomyces mutabilis TaxID=67332 RepID=UPI0006934C99|nr:hypothetical protein [Streptomyces mutabilis]
MVPWPAKWKERWAFVQDFVAADLHEVYRHGVRAGLADPSTARLLGRRDGAHAGLVQLRMLFPENEQQVRAASARELVDASRAWSALGEAQRKQREAAEATAWKWWAVCLTAAAAGITVLAAWGQVMGSTVLAATALICLVLRQRETQVWADLRQCFRAGWLALGVLALRCQFGFLAALWGQELRRHAIKPVIVKVVRSMLGEDPDSLLITDNYDGLRSPRGRGYVVDSAPTLLLRRKLSQIDAGTVAVCGPRGAGKTTLLETCVQEADFGLLAQAPATYAPHDFVLSLSVQLCETYVEAKGYDLPEFARLSNIRRFLRRVWGWCKRRLHWSAFALPAAACLVLGGAAAARLLRDYYEPPVRDYFGTLGDSLMAWAELTWRGQAAGTSVSLLIVGALWWRLRTASWLLGFLRQSALALSALAGVALCLVSLATLLADKGVVQRLGALSSATVLRLCFYAVLCFVLSQAASTGRRLPAGGLQTAVKTAFRWASRAMALLLVVFVLRNPETQAVLADPENPLRIAAVLTGLLLLKASNWKPRPAEPALVTRCRNHLYRLQTIQSSSAALTTGASQIGSLGTVHTTSVSTIPPNFPELVGDFRELLSQIAAEYRKEGGRVVLAIDEVDRLGSETQALAFLGEIKAVLGVPHVHYLISVAEDVGAAFVRRGLPHRDVTDSSLDDVVYVQPSTLQESRTIMARRAPGLSDPYIMLAHALSGGIPRDLLRYGRRIMETRDKTASDELADISRGLVLQELAETLAGFRTLLSKKQWSPDTYSVLNAFRNLVAHLRSACPCTEFEVHYALEQFAIDSANDLGQTPHADLTEEARHLIDEASGYAYFSLTLLDIFSADGFDRRLQAAAERGPNGDPELLAEARQELGLSPYSARTLISAIREAWLLPLQPASGTGTIPPPRSRPCSQHQQIL